MKRFFFSPQRIILRSRKEIFFLLKQVVFLFEGKEYTHFLLCGRYSDCTTAILLMHLQCQITPRKTKFSNSKIYGLTVWNTHTHSVTPRAKPNKFLGSLISSHAGMQCQGCNSVQSGCVLSARGLRQQRSALAERREFRIPTEGSPARPAGAARDK